MGPGSGTFLPLKRGDVMQIRKSLSVSLVALLGSTLLFACSSDDKAANAGPSGNGGKGGSGSETDGGGGGGQGNADAGACDVTLKPSADDLATVQGALDTAKSGSTVCFSAGTYKFTNHISLSA